MGFPNLVKLLISVILLYVPSLVCSTGNSTVTTTSVQTTPYATVNSIVALTLTEEMDYRYNLTEIPNIYDWNLTKIALILNETNPTYLYTGITTSIMLEFLPPYLLEHLPYSVLAYHGLCQYLPSNYSVQIVVKQRMSLQHYVLAHYNFQTLIILSNTLQ